MYLKQQLNYWKSTLINRNSNEKDYFFRKMDNQNILLFCNLLFSNLSMRFKNKINLIVWRISKDLKIEKYIS